jgi:hypothetical protein
MRLVHIHAGGGPAFCLGDLPRLEARATLDRVAREAIDWPEGAAVCLDCINFGKPGPGSDDRSKER